MITGTIVPIIPLMRGRPSQFDPQQAMQAAMNVFWSHGFTGTSISDLLEATNLSRSSLYQTFTSKESLFRDCLNQYCDLSVRQLRTELDRCPSGRTFIEQTFMNVARQADDPDIRRGCLAMNTAMELGHEETDISHDVHAGLQKFTSVFTDAVKRAQAEGDIAAENSATELGCYLVSSMCGLRMFIKSGMRPGDAGRVVRIILKALD